MVGWDFVWGQCRPGGAWPPRAESGVRGQHAPALHCIYNPCVTAALGALLRSGSVPWSLCSRASWQCLYHGPHTPPISILWTGRARHQRRCSWPTIYPRLSGRACLQTPDLRDHSLPWFLSDHPDACCLIFGPESLTMDSSYILNLFTKLQYNNSHLHFIRDISVCKYQAWKSCSDPSQSNQGLYQRDRCV